MSKLNLFLFSAFVFPGSICLADTVTLRSGKELVGDLITAGPGNVHIAVNGQLMIFPTVAVESILFEFPDEQSESTPMQNSVGPISIYTDVLFKVLSVKVVDDSRIDLIFESLRSIKLSNGDHLDAGTLVEAHFLMSEREIDWVRSLTLDRALTADLVVELKHQPVSDIDKKADKSVLHSRGQRIDIDQSSIPELVRESSVIHIKFSGVEREGIS